MVVVTVTVPPGTQTYGLLVGTAAELEGEVETALLELTVVR